MQEKIAKYRNTWYRRIFTENSPVGYLGGIFIKEEYRMGGIAKKLLTQCEDWAKGEGCSEFACDCELNNTNSLKFH